MIKVNFELWKDVKSFEGLYQVSTLGRVRSLDKYIDVKIRNVDKVLKRGKILKPSYDKDGYLRICLCENQQRIYRSIHRLVAMAFIPNPDNKPCVNHIDSDITNNKVDNLEWVTPKENVHHSYLYGKRVKLKNVQRETILTDFQVSQITTLRTIYTVSQISKLFNCKYTTLKNIIRKQKKSEILDNQQPSLYTSIYKDVEEGSTTKEHTPNLGDDIV